MEPTEKTGKLNPYPLWIEWYNIKQIAKFSFFGGASIDPPQFFRDEVALAASDMTTGELQYTRYYGSNALLKSISDNFSSIAHYERVNSETQLYASLGAVNVIFEAILSRFTSDDDEMLSFQPLYPLHHSATLMKGKSVVANMNFNERTNRFEFDFDDFAAKLSDKTKVVVFCNPSNPTGRVITDEEYQKFTDILEQYPNVVVIEDAAYCVYTSSKVQLKYFHEFGNNKDKSLTVFSGGKIINATGIRAGWCFGNEKLISDLKKKKSVYMAIPVLEERIIERCLGQAMKPYKESENFWEFSRKDVEERALYFKTELEKIGLSTTEWEGSYYFLVNIESLVPCVEEKYYYKINNSEEKEPFRDRAVSRKIITEYQVGFLPFSSCQVVNHDDRFLRVIFNRSYEDINSALESLRSLNKSLQ